MNESIRENIPRSTSPPRLPDCCNVGVWLRVLLAVNGGSLLVAFARSANGDIGDFGGIAREVLSQFVVQAALLEPVAMGSLLVLCGLRWLLARLGDKAGALLVLGSVLGVTVFFHRLFSPMLGTPSWVAQLWAALAVALLLGYFDLRARAQSPALTEARLLALTARIRPHFLFNTLNAVLGVLRSDPRRAERALEELSDLFRALMRDNRELVPLSDELALARQYLELEKLRLGERLQVRWEIESCPADALMPPLMLQPLLENAVYHGIEPAALAGELVVKMTGKPGIHGSRGHRVIEISNPVVSGGGHHAGNRMALANIRERLMLYYDLEARLDIVESADRYTVRIELPDRKK